jgi:hypothetical protein
MNAYGLSLSLYPANALFKPRFAPGCPLMQRLLSLAINDKIREGEAERMARIYFPQATFQYQLNNTSKLRKSAKEAFYSPEIFGHTLQARGHALQVSGYALRVAGDPAEVPGCSAELKRDTPEVPGCSVELKRDTPEVLGCSAELKGDTPEVLGCSAEVKGDTPEELGCSAELAGDSLLVRRDAAEPFKASNKHVFYSLKHKN